MFFILTMNTHTLFSNNRTLEESVTTNFNRLNFNAGLFPIFLLLLISFFLFIENAFSAQSYAQIQKDLFLSLNSQLSTFPQLQLNLTQLGDVLIFLPFLTLFIVSAPKFWQSLLTALLFSGIISILLKKLFSVPRPAAMFDNNTFVIIGERLSGSTSLPSGHSIAAFTILTLIFFGFSPKTTKLKIAWLFFILMSGIIIALTRVGVGAHYPLDVIIGGVLGYISAILGVFLNRQFLLWGCIKKTVYYPVFIFLLAVWAIILINKIIALNLMIFYFSLAFLLITLFVITRIYVKQQS